MKRLLLWAVAASLLVAVVVTVVSLWQTPTYEASARVLVDVGSPAQETGNVKIRPIPNAPSPAILQALTQTMILYIDTRPVAEETIQRLDLRMSPEELLTNLAVEQMETSQLILLSYQDTNPQRAEQIVNTVGRIAAERITGTGSEKLPLDTELTATLYDEASVPEAPASPKPLRNGLIALVVALVLCAGTALARTSGRARAAGTLGERPSRLAKLVGQAGVLGGRHSAPSIFERVKEKKLLRALGRRGKLTAVEAALETSLSVEDATRILFELAHNGQLEVTVEPGKLLYSFWEHDAS